MCRGRKEQKERLHSENLARLWSKMYYVRGCSLLMFRYSMSARLRRHFPLSEQKTPSTSYQLQRDNFSSLPPAQTFAPSELPRPVIMLKLSMSKTLITSSPPVMLLILRKRRSRKYRRWCPIRAKSRVLIGWKDWLPSILRTVCRWSWWWSRS